MDKVNAVIDLNCIEDLRKLQRPGRPDFVAELIELFIESFDTGLLKIQTFVAEKDLRSLSALTHSLKSNAASLGALSLAELLLRMEKMANGDLATESFDILADQIKSEYHKAKNALETLKAKV